MPNKDEFNLSEKRASFYEETLKLTTTKDEELLINTIFQFIEKQDKEFIKKVDEIVLSEKSAITKYEEIHKLAGKNLI